MMESKNIYRGRATLLLLTLLLVSCRDDSNHPNQSPDNSLPDQTKSDFVPPPVPQGGSGQPTQPNKSKPQDVNESQQNSGNTPSDEQTPVIPSPYKDLRVETQKDPKEKENTPPHDLGSRAAGSSLTPAAGQPAPLSGKPNDSNQSQSGPKKPLRPQNRLFPEKSHDLNQPRTSPQKPPKPNSTLISAKSDDSNQPRTSPKKPPRRKGTENSIPNASNSALNAQQSRTGSLDEIRPAALQQQHFNNEEMNFPVDAAKLSQARRSPTPAGELGGLSCNAEQEIKAFLDDPSPEKCKALPVHHLKMLTGDELSGLGVQCLMALAQSGSTASLKHLESDQLRAISKQLPDCFSGLTPSEQLNAITGDQFEILTEKLEMNLFPFLMQKHFGHRSWEKRDDIRREKEKTNYAESVNSIHAMIAGEIIPSKSRLNFKELFLDSAQFTPEKIRFIPSEFMSDFWCLPLLSTEQIQALTPEQIEHLPAQAFSFVTENQARSFKKQQVEKILLDNSKVRNLSRVFIEVLAPEVTEEAVEDEFSVGKIKNLGAPSKIMKLFSPKAKGDYWKAQFKAMILKWGKMSTRKITAIQPHQFILINNDELNLLNDQQTSALLPEQIAHLDADVLLNWSRLQHLTKDQIQSLYFNCMLDAYRMETLLGKMLPEQRSWIQTESSSLDEAYQILLAYHPNNSRGFRISKLSDSQINEIPAEVLSVLSLSEAHMLAFKPSQISHFSEEAIGDLDLNSIAHFIRPEILKYLTYRQLVQINPSVITEPRNQLERKRAEEFQKALGEALDLEARSQDAEQ